MTSLASTEAAWTNIRMYFIFNGLLTIILALGMAAGRGLGGVQHHTGLFHRGGTGPGGTGLNGARRGTGEVGETGAGPRREDSGSGHVIMGSAQAFSSYGSRHTCIKSLGRGGMLHGRGHWQHHCGVQMVFTGHDHSRKLGDKF